MKIQFKFKDLAAPSRRQGVIDELGAKGAKAVRPLFPSEADPELASLFVVEAGEEQNLRPLLDYLSRSADVEFAEQEARRKLLR